MESLATEDVGLKYDMHVHQEFAAVLEFETLLGRHVEIRSKAVNVGEDAVTLLSDTIHPDDGYQPRSAAWHPRQRCS